MRIKAPAFMSRINLYKWGAIALFYIASVTGAFFYGGFKNEQKHLEADAKEAKERAALIVDHVKARIPEVQKDDAEAAKLRAEMAVLRREYNEAINARPDLPECALTDDELRYFQEAARRTH